MPDSGAEAAAAFAENLAKTYKEQGKPILPLFAAFVGLVFRRDESVGRDCLTALDRLVCGDASNE